MSKTTSTLENLSADHKSNMIVFPPPRLKLLKFRITELLGLERTLKITSYIP